MARWICFVLSCLLLLVSVRAEQGVGYEIAVYWGSGCAPPTGSQGVYAHVTMVNAITDQTCTRFSNNFPVLGDPSNGGVTAKAYTLICYSTGGSSIQMYSDLACLSPVSTFEGPDDRTRCQDSRVNGGKTVSYRACCSRSCAPGGNPNGDGNDVKGSAAQSQPTLPDKIKIDANGNPVPSAAVSVSSTALSFACGILTSVLMALRR